jgi:hypothetical protein
LAIGQPICDGEEAEARVLAADAHVERGGEDAGAPVREPVHHPDGRLGRRADLVAAPAARRVPRVQLGLRVLAVVLALLVDVAARGEGLRPGAGDHDAADLVVRVHRHDRVVQLGRQPVVHRVEVLGAIHGEDGHARGLLDEDVLVHG